MNTVVVILLCFLIVLFITCFCQLNNKNSELANKLKKISKRTKLNENYSIRQKVQNDDSIQNENLPVQNTTCGNNPPSCVNTQNMTPGVKTHRVSMQLVPRAQIIEPENSQLNQYVDSFIRGRENIVGYDYSYPLGFYGVGSWTPVGYISTQNQSNDTIMLLESRRRDDGYYDYRVIKSQEGGIKNSSIFE